MFNVDGKEFITLVLVALVVLGPEKLPEVFRRAGRIYSEVKRMSEGFQSEFQRALEEPTKQINETRDLVRESMDFRPSDDPSSNGTSNAGGDDAGVDSGANTDAAADPDAAADTGAADRDQAEVERRIAEMERANPPTFAGPHLSESTEVDPTSTGVAADDPPDNGEETE